MGPKGLKIDVFDNPTVVWGPLSRKSPRNLILPETRVIALYLRCWQCRSIVIQIFMVSSENSRILKHMRNGRSRLSKVVDFGTNQKRVCVFLLVINSNLGPIELIFWKVSYPKFPNFSKLLLVTLPGPGLSCFGFPVTPRAFSIFNTIAYCGYFVLCCIGLML